MLPLFLHERLTRNLLHLYLIATLSLPCFALTQPKSWIVPKGVPFSSLDKLEFKPMQDFWNKGDANNYCRVSTRAIGLNFADIFCLLGLYSAANEVRGDASFCPGLEFSGVIVNDPTNTFQPGQRVLGFSRFSSYADIVQAPPEFLYPLPSSWTFQEGSAFMVQALTAWHGLVEIGRLPKGGKQVVLVHSASGGVGLWASEMAARRGATVVGVIGSAKKQKVFEDRIIPLSPNSRTLIRGDEKDFSVHLAKVLCEVHGTTASLPEKKELEYLRDRGNGVDLVMESLGGQYFTDSFEALNSGGGLVTFGSTSYVSPGLSLNKIRLIWRYINRPKIDPGTLTSRNIRLAGFNLIYLTERTDELRRQLRECIRCLSGLDDTFDSSDEIVPLDNVIPPVIGDSYDFRTQTITALERLKSGLTVGKIVLDNNENDAT